MRGFKTKSRSQPEGRKELDWRTARALFEGDGAVPTSRATADLRPVNGFDSTLDRLL